MKENEKLADKIHDFLCHDNHNHQCDYLWGDWKNPSPTNKTYLKKADEILKLIDIKTALEIVKILF